ncbi:MAG TPA: RluA family pseudouridine synthase [Alphaproteobacteria bacterium]|jgi:23S rRNA pseudouridine955/2504/2580 synthase
MSKPPAANVVQTLKVGDDEADQRLDRWFKRRFPALGHGKLEKLLRTGQVRVDGKRAKAAFRLEPGMEVRVPPLGDLAPATDRPITQQPRVSKGDAEALRASVLHRDDDVIVINKPPGLAVQGGTGTAHHLDAMLDALKFDKPDRPKLVHRLDRDTSGTLVLARTTVAARWLTAAFRARTTRKVYWSLVVGVPKIRQGRIDIALSKLPGPRGEKMVGDEDEGKRAVTLYAVVEHAATKAAWLAMMPVTGRTHQLRAHAAALNTPILGDGKYGGEAAFFRGPEGDGGRPRLHLHAREIEFIQPNGRLLRVVAPLPPHMRSTWEFFGFDPNMSADSFADLAELR